MVRAKPRSLSSTQNLRFLPSLALSNGALLVVPNSAITFKGDKPVIVLFDDSYSEKGR